MSSEICRRRGAGLGCDAGRGVLLPRLAGLVSHSLEPARFLEPSPPRKSMAGGPRWKNDESRWALQSENLPRINRALELAKAELDHALELARLEALASERSMA